MKLDLPDEWFPSSSTNGSGMPSANGERSSGPRSLAFSGVSTDSASCSVVRFTWTRTAARSVGGGGGVAGGTGREEEQALASRLKAVEEEGRGPNIWAPTPSLLWLSLGSFSEGC